MCPSKSDIGRANPTERFHYLASLNTYEAFKLLPKLTSSINDMRVSRSLIACGAGMQRGRFIKRKCRWDMLPVHD
jgi:hypothetical protein